MAALAARIVETSKYVSNISSDAPSFSGVDVNGGVTGEVHTGVGECK